MPGMSIQFHAEPTELMPLLAAAAACGASILALRDSPFVATEVHNERDALTSLSENRVCGFVLTLGTPTIAAAASDDDLLRLNPGSLLLQVGRLTKDGLRESWLTCADAHAS